MLISWILKHPLIPPLLRSAPQRVLPRPPQARGIPLEPGRRLYSTSGREGGCYQHTDIIIQGIIARYRPSMAFFGDNGISLLRASYYRYQSSKITERLMLFLDLRL